LLVTVSVAFTVPVVRGLKVIVNGMLCPAEIVTGRDSAPTVNSELFVLAAVTVTLAPLAVRLPEADPLLPSTTLPRARVVGEMESCPTAVVPVPDNEIVNVGFDASEVMVTLPLAFPEDPGANLTLKLVLWPAFTVRGAVIPLNVKPVPLIAT